MSNACTIGKYLVVGLSRPEVWSLGDGFLIAAELDDLVVNVSDCGTHNLVCDVDCWRVHDRGIELGSAEKIGQDLNLVRREI